MRLWQDFERARCPALNDAQKPYNLINAKIVIKKFFAKKMRKNLWVQKKAVPLHRN